MFCSKCGKQNPDGAQFCAACGNKFMPMTMPGQAYIGGQDQAQGQRFYQPEPEPQQHYSQYYMQQQAAMQQQTAPAVANKGNVPLIVTASVLGMLVLGGIVYGGVQLAKYDDGDTGTRRDKDDSSIYINEIDLGRPEPSSFDADKFLQEQIEKGEKLSGVAVDDDSSMAQEADSDADNVADAGTAENSGKVYNIYVWNSEFRTRFEDYYWDNRDESLWDGVEVNWVEHPNYDFVYQSMLDDAIKNQYSADDDDKIDMFLVEADYAKKYVESDVPLDVVGEIGITWDDLANQYDYTHDVMTDSNGILKGVSWQATPGLFLYNADYAEQVLGTSDPEEVQKYVCDWDTFGETAQKMKDEGIYMLSGYDDSYRCFSNNASSQWVIDGTVTVDPQIKEWVDCTKEFSDAGYIKGSNLWDEQWVAGQKIDGKVFGYFFSTWGIPFTLMPNTLDQQLDDGGKAELGNGGYGRWRACIGPQSYFWGGTWLCGAYGSDNIAITRDIMLKMTCDTEIMKDITETEQDYCNNREAIKQLIDEGYSNPFLGGQDHLSLLTESADSIDAGNISAYDSGCTESFQGAMREYFLGNCTYDEALEAFRQSVLSLYPGLSM